MSKTSITHIFLQANPRSALTVNTGYNEMFACLKAGQPRTESVFQFFGRGQTVVGALQDLDADIEKSGVTVQTFAFAGHAQQELDAAREKAFAEMCRQIAEEEAVALDKTRLTEEIDLTETFQVTKVEHLAEVTV